MTDLIAQKIREINTHIPANVRLVAVTKQVTVEKMRAAYEAGIRDFGENRLQEALAKQQQLKDLSDITWHFIGHLQTNKAKKVIENFDWIHSVDSLKLSQVLNRIAGELAIQPKVCLQVKVLGDPTKYGWQIEELLTDLSELNQLENLNIQGLMTILPLGLSDAETLAAFKKTQELAEKIKQQNFEHLSMSQLSMGMSGDYLFAIQAGATMIRLGSIIFGERH
jgi:hypothetical protein